MGYGVFGRWRRRRRELQQLSQRVKITNGGSTVLSIYEGGASYTFPTDAGYSFSVDIARHGLSLPRWRSHRRANSQNFTALIEGLPVTVTDSKGCQNTSAGLAITLNALPTATVSAPGPYAQVGGKTIQAAG